MHQVFFSNVGGTATMIGDPPNIIVGNALHEHINFVDFMRVLGTGTLLLAVPCMFFLLHLFRYDLAGAMSGCAHNHDNSNNHNNNRAAATMQRNAMQ